MEILAPAGGPEQLTAALRAGADAVYLGLAQFSARGADTGRDRMPRAGREGLCCAQYAD